MSRQYLDVISATLREILARLHDLRAGRVEPKDVLRLIDELENQFDTMLSELAPERITDERFEATLKAVKEVTANMRRLREAIMNMKLNAAEKIALDVQESIRNAFRLLILIRAGAPVPVIFQVTPQFLRDVTLNVPEAIMHTSPMAAQIYNILARRGEATIEELAMELRVDDKTREEFNNAIARLISMGFVRPQVTPDNRILLKLARR